MKNLIIGSSGFIGRYLCQYLKNLGEDVIEYDIARTSIEDARYNKLPLDNIDRVYFLAWKVGGAKYLYDPTTQQEQLNWNIKLLTNVMEQLSHIPFVFASSQLAEDCDTVYGVIKRLGEVWTNLIGGRTIRFWNIYGPYEEQSIKSHVVADFIHQALKKGMINMVTDGNEKRQFIHADDICNALCKSFDYNSGVYDASSLQWNSIYEIAQLVGKHTGCVIMRGQNKGSSLMIENKPRICEAKISLETGIEKTVRLFQDRNNQV